MTDLATTNKAELTPAQAEAAAIVAKWTADADKAKAKLEAFATNLPNGEDFKKAGALVVYEMFLQMVNGELRPRNLDEATKSAQRIIDIVAGVELMELGAKVRASADPAATLRELTKVAESRAVPAAKP